MIQPLHSYTTIDKSTWGPGPWQDEPDKVQWKDEATGLPCLAVRQENHGAWCGYVGVAEGHPYFGKGYEDLDVDVHGGLTFADRCQPEEDSARSICHIPEAGQPDHVWWLGFDCMHAGDVAPGHEANALALGLPQIGEANALALGLPQIGELLRGHSILGRPCAYRDLAYVQDEVTNLARQLAALAVQSR